MKTDDDFGNALMMRYHDGIPLAASLDYEEELQAHSPRLRELTGKIQECGGLTPGEEMSLWFARAEAKKQIERSGIRQWDVFGNEITDDEDGDD